jgi:hypothetical protein
MQYLVKKVIQFFKHGNINPYKTLIIKQENLKKLKDCIEKAKGILLNQNEINNASSQLDKEINIFKERVKILKKKKIKRLFPILLFFIKGGYSNFNGIWTAIKDIFSNNYNKT